nr:MAG TPA: hypothetical protein [Caudoviricetes sp.]
MRRLDHKMVWSPLFFEIFSVGRAQRVSPKWQQNGAMRWCETVWCSLNFNKSTE